MALTDKLTAIADAIRAKTGKSETMTLDQMPLEIEGITGGGGGGVDDDRVKYVTFIGLDGNVLHSQPVISGDTCRDPVTNKYIETPTKESTVQYTYTYSGWSLTDGGDASGSALTNVTEDRTVYVAFKEEVRKYTITFYDSDGTTVLTTKSVNYGSIPSYIPSKTGYSLIGWQPELVSVTGDASYVAQWEELVTFAGSSWEDIIAAVEEGKAETLFAVGNTRTELLGSETVTYTIVGFNQETKYSTYPVPTMTIMSSVLSTNKQMFTTDVADGTELKYTTSEVYKYLNDTIMPLLPAELQSGLKRSKKEFTSTTNTTYSLDLKLWAPSYAEVNRTGTLKYSYFTASARMIGRKADGTATKYWTRGGISTSGWYYVETTGSLKNTKTTTTEMGVRFCFGI